MPMSLVAAAAAALSFAAAQPPSPPSTNETVAPGRYRLVLRYTIHAEMPVLGQTTSVTTTSALVNVDDDGNAHQHVCAIATTSGSVTTAASAGLIRGMPDTDYALRVVAGKLAADLGVGALGYDPKKNAGLPHGKDDDAVTDPDGDGVPGAAMDVTMPGFGRFPVNIVSRGHTVLEGRVVANGAAGRAFLNDADERVLAGFLFANALPAQKVVPDVDKSGFALEKIADDAGCNEVMHATNSAVRLASNP